MVSDQHSVLNLKAGAEIWNSKNMEQIKGWAWTSNTNLYSWINFHFKIAEMSMEKSRPKYFVILSHMKRSSDSEHKP